MFTLLPFVNPINLLTNGVSLAYLASWPFIIQNLGQDVLLSQSLIIIILMIICDAARQLVVRRIGFDFVSVPVGLAVLSGLNSKPGATFLSLTKPIYSTLLILIKPTLIMVETYYLLDVLKKFNSWISRMANKREDIRHDPYTWEAPLTRSAVVARIIVTLSTMASYVGAYIMIVICQNNLYKSIGTIPTIFEQSMVALITFQVLAMATTIVKEEGIISETAFICLTSATAIMFASLHQSQIIASALLESGLVAIFLMIFSNIFSNDRQHRGKTSARHADHLISKQTLIKTILLLSYTQMLVQQHRQQATTQSQLQTTTSWLMNAPSNLFGSLWPSASAQASFQSQQTMEGIISFGAGVGSNGSPIELAGNLLTNFLSGLFLSGRNSLGAGDALPRANIHYSGPLWTFEALDKLWIKELGSTTIQRLIQSMMIQIFYILSLIFARTEEDEYEDDMKGEESDEDE